jgi:N-terminal region of glycosyl transferase group 7
MSSDKGGPEERLKSGVSDNWQKCFSATHKQDYWFNSSNGIRSWEDPALVESSLKKRRIEESEKSDEKHMSSSNGTKSSGSSCQKSAVESTKVTPEIAIIVPYRDLHVKQCRKQQLDLFIPSISKFMELNKDRSSYRIYIIEQSNDGRKFNRGKLLNIGFKIACADGCKAFIFHDVDLLPSEGMSLPSVFMHLTFLFLTVCF